ncbi:hypothetical protein PIIN_07079 [Serendipita indica DSM 11827]|uniref:Uncharacterized protein n=1 Tax=Serendipita indica (strain DSM 11827) TaxID=1109443 RepID=G4TP72_SERID|nr:hypothetical protein PIIN_07079 [Serendipita indica DSM 11827]
MRRMHILTEADILGVCVAALFALPSVRAILLEDPDFASPRRPDWYYSKHYHYLPVRDGFSNLKNNHAETKERLGASE